jgi:hypothetical protein
MGAFGVAVVQSAYGMTFITAGTTVLVGGLIVLALSVAVHQLSRIAETLKARPAPRPARTNEPAEAAPPVAAQPAAPLVAAAAPRVTPPRPPAPAPVVPPLREPHAPEHAPDVSAEAIERLRASIVRPERNGEAVMTEAEDVPLSPRPPARPAPQRTPATAEAPVVVAPPAPAEPASAEPRKPRLDFLFRSRPAPKRTESFDTVWPADARQPKAARVEPQIAAPAALAPAEQPPAVQAPPMAINGNGEGHPPAAILKSGVVDGMAYTLYADGSIEATLPQGTVRFGSIAELRSHIEANS